MPTALKRRQENGSVVVPVLAQDCARKLLAIDDINYLPKDPSGKLKPLAKWHGAERDSGFRQITEHVLVQIERCRRRVERDVNAAISLGRPTEPPTRVVDALYRGDHATLVDALRSAHPGDRILIRPGMYRENIIIDKPVEIVGDGKIDDVIIETTEGTTVLCQTNMARIANLTLRQAGNGNYHCIDIAQGRLDLEECDITSQSQGRACVAIHDGADPRLRRNRIHDGKEGGVFVYANGKGTLEDNDIFANAGAGVEIREGGNPTLRRNRISQNALHAIRVYDGGQGIFEDNDLRGNGAGAWDVSPDCLDKVMRKHNQE